MELAVLAVMAAEDSAEERRWPSGGRRVLRCSSQLVFAASAAVFVASAAGFVASAGLPHFGSLFLLLLRNKVYEMYGWLPVLGRGKGAPLETSFSEISLAEWR